MGARDTELRGMEVVEEVHDNEVHSSEARDIEEAEVGNDEADGLRTSPHCICSLESSQIRGTPRLHGAACEDVCDVCEDVCEDVRDVCDGGGGQAQLGRGRDHTLRTPAPPDCPLQERGGEKEEEEEVEEEEVEEQLKVTFVDICCLEVYSTQ